MYFFSFPTCTQTTGSIFTPANCLASITVTQTYKIFCIWTHIPVVDYPTSSFICGIISLESWWRLIGCARFKIKWRKWSFMNHGQSYNLKSSFSCKFYSKYSTDKLLRTVLWPKLLLYICSEKQNIWLNMTWIWAFTQWPYFIEVS